MASPPVGVTNATGALVDTPLHRIAHRSVSFAPQLHCSSGPPRPTSRAFHQLMTAGVGVHSHNGNKIVETSIETGALLFNIYNYLDTHTQFAVAARYQSKARAFIVVVGRCGGRRRGDNVEHHSLLVVLWFLLQ